jgi:hypothetical protein
MKNMAKYGNGCEVLQDGCIETKQITKKVHLSSQVNKRLRKWKGKLRMDSPEKLLTLGTQDIRQRQTKQKTQKKPRKLNQ